MRLRGVSVLVVEDDRAHRDLAQDMLTALGARVTVAANGEDGVKRLIADGCPDLILCNLRMPVMDGFACQGGPRILTMSSRRARCAHGDARSGCVRPDVERRVRRPP